MKSLPNSTLMVGVCGQCGRHVLVRKGLTQRIMYCDPNKGTKFITVVDCPQCVNENIVVEPLGLWDRFKLWAQRLRSGGLNTD